MYIPSTQAKQFDPATGRIFSRKLLKTFLAFLPGVGLHGQKLKKVLSNVKGEVEIGIRNRKEQIDLSSLAENCHLYRAMWYILILSALWFCTVPGNIAIIIKNDFYFWSEPLLGFWRYLSCLYAGSIFFALSGYMEPRLLSILK